MKNSKTLAFLQLMRPANIITAFADIMTGYVIGLVSLAETYDGWHASLFASPSLIWLLLSTFGLYGGGVVFNDYFDAELDKRERPERPIPSGRATKVEAGLLGLLLLIGGNLAALQVGQLSFFLAFGITILALFYDKYAKHHTFSGPFTMGLCRGGNLLLGVSAFPEAIGANWFLVLIPVLYIGAITLISQGEVHGGKKINLSIGLTLYITVILFIIGLGFVIQTGNYFSLTFLALFAYLIIPPLFSALKQNDPMLIGKAVKAGVLALIALNASLAATYGGWLPGLIILLLLPVSLALAKVFAVT